MADAKVKGPSGYMFFSEQHRDKVRQHILEDKPAGTKVSVAVVAKALGEQWKALTDEEKEKYKQQAKQRAEEMAAAREAAGAEAGEGGEQAEANTAPKGFPIALVKRVMHMDPEVQRAGADAVWAMGKATELFVELLAGQCCRAATAHKRKTIKMEDFAAAVKCDKRFVLAGLKDVVTGVQKSEEQAVLAATTGVKRKAAADAAAAAVEEGDKDAETGAAADQQEGKAAGAGAAPRVSKASAKKAAAVKDIHKITTFFVKRAATGPAGGEDGSKAAPPAAAAAAAGAAGPSSPVLDGLENDME